jgi:hypothetical protein
LIWHTALRKHISQSEAREVWVVRYHPDTHQNSETSLYSSTRTDKNHRDWHNCCQKMIRKQHHLLYHLIPEICKGKCDTGHMIMETEGEDRSVDQRSWNIAGNLLFSENMFTVWSTCRYPKDWRSLNIWKYFQFILHCVMSTNITQNWQPNC